MIVTPDGDVDDEQRINDSADDSDYDDAPVANPTSKSLPSKIRNKKSEPKLTLDRNFMCFLRPHTFDHELFRRGKEDIYSITEIERFDSDYRRQLHFNFSATRITQKQKLAFDATRASRLRDVDLDALPDNTLSTSALASVKIFRDTYWRTYWTAPLVVDSLYALQRRITMTNGADIIRKLRELSKVTSRARVCPLRRGRCQAKDIWSCRAVSPDPHTTTTSA
jgi:hypothetical protein